MKYTILLTFIFLSACGITQGKKEAKVNLVKQHETALAYLKKGDPKLGQRFYPLPASFDTKKYQVDVFPNFIRYTHEIRHSGLESPFNSYLKFDSTEDEIAQRYRTLVLRRKNTLKAKSKLINKAITRFVKIDKIPKHFSRNNLDNALFEVTPSGDIVSLLVRANQFSTSFGLKQFVNTYQTQQTFLIFGSRAKTIVRKIKFELSP